MFCEEGKLLKLMKALFPQVTNITLEYNTLYKTNIHRIFKNAITS